MVPVIVFPVPAIIATLYIVQFCTMDFLYIALSPPRDLHNLDNTGGYLFCH